MAKTKASPRPTALLALALALLPLPLAADEAKPHRIEGFSDMVKVGKAEYLVVYDRKSNKPAAPRIARVTIEKDGLVIQPLEVADWKHADGPSNDLENLCRLPNGDFLASESGTREGQFGRLFRFAVAGNVAEIKAVYAAPKLKESTKEGKGDDYEGLVCTAGAGARVLLIFGERGGSKPYPQGALRWGWLDLATDQVSYPEEGLKGIEVAVPGVWVNPEDQRDIGALYLDAAGTLWGAATEDAGDSGPFRSVVVKLGKVDATQNPPIALAGELKPTWIVDGFKIEALGEAWTDKGGLAFGTEDEDLGGALRELFKAP